MIFLQDRVNAFPEGLLAFCFSAGLGTLDILLASLLAAPICLKDARPWTF